MLPIGDYTVAKRNSIHFNKGDRKWENKTVDTETYLHLMETVVRNIAKEWPSGQWADPSFQVKIQHDGAPAVSTRRSTGTFQWRVLSWLAHDARRVVH